MMEIIVVFQKSYALMFQLQSLTHVLILVVLNSTRSATNLTPGQKIIIVNSVALKMVMDMLLLLALIENT